MDTFLCLFFVYFPPVLVFANELENVKHNFLYFSPTKVGTVRLLDVLVIPRSHVNKQRTYYKIHSLHIPCFFVMVGIRSCNVEQLFRHLILPIYNYPYFLEMFDFRIRPMNVFSYLSIPFLVHSVLQFLIIIDSTFISAIFDISQPHPYSWSEFHGQSISKAAFEFDVWTICYIFSLQNVNPLFLGIYLVRLVNYDQLTEHSDRLVFF